MKFLCLVHFSAGAFDGMTEADGIRLNDATIAHDRKLRESGNLLLASPLREPDEGTTIDRRRLKLDAIDGPFAEAKEVVGGFLLIEADDLEAAAALFDDDPIAQYGRIEIRPLNEGHRHSETGDARPEFSNT
jgi:hypothetical protein